MGSLEGVLADAPTRAGAGVVRPCALFVGDLGAMLMAATVANLLNMAVRSPPLLRVVERVGSYGFAWTGWGTVLVLVLLLSFLGMNGHYTRRMPFWLELKGVTLGAFFAFAGDGLIRTALFGAAYDFESIVRWPLMVPALLLTRHATRVVLQQNGLWTLRTLVIGPRTTVPDARLMLASEPGLGYDVVATTDLGEAAEPAGCLADAVRDSRCEFVLLLVGAADARAERTVMSVLNRMNVPYALVPATASHMVPAIGFSSQHHLSPGVVMLVRNNRLARLFSRTAKTALDAIAAMLLLLLLSPLFIVLAWMIRADGGPALFRHERIGANGRRFRCLKFRTMVTNGDAVLRELLLNDADARATWAAKQKLVNDPRITPVGSFLRSTSLDELPQLINVVKGEMSLVGPRPIVEAEAHHYGCDFAYYCDAKPGITGLWQVSGRSGTSYEERVRLDVWYIQNWSVWHDCAILLKTIPAVLQRRGAV